MPDLPFKLHALTAEALPESADGYARGAVAVALAEEAGRVIAEMASGCESVQTAQIGMAVQALCKAARRPVIVRNDASSPSPASPRPWAL